MSDPIEIIDVDAGNVGQHGFFCYMSKKKEPGYKQKTDWLDARFREGLKLKIAHEPGGRNVGLIEYTPGEHAWRAVHAPGYLVIHCLWVVGKGKGKGTGTRLVQECLADARKQGLRGVAMLSSDRVWLASSELFLRNGFVEVGSAPPSFHLLVHRLGAAPDPALPGDWQDRQARYGSGLSVVYTPQCPYIHDAVRTVKEVAGERGLPVQVVELKSAVEVQEASPTAFGTFAILRDGRLLSYYYQLPKDVARLLDER